MKIFWYISLCFLFYSCTSVDKEMQSIAGVKISIKDVLVSNHVYKEAFNKPSFAHFYFEICNDVDSMKTFYTGCLDCAIYINNELETILPRLNIQDYFLKNEECLEFYCAIPLLMIDDIQDVQNSVVLLYTDSCSIDIGLSKRFTNECSLLDFNQDTLYFEFKAANMRVE